MARFTPDEDTTLLALRGAGGQYKAISAVMRRPEASLRCRYDMLRHPEYVPPVALIPRVCLGRCRKTFMAIGRFNRLCPMCSDTASRASPLAVFAGGRDVDLNAGHSRVRHGETSVRVVVPE